VLAVWDVLLRQQVRAKAGRRARPSVAVIDPIAQDCLKREQRRYDRRQKDQRHDGLLLLAVLVNLADIQNRMGAGALLVRLAGLLASGFAALALAATASAPRSKLALKAGQEHEELQFGVSRQAGSAGMRVCRIRNRSKFRGYENGFPAHFTRTYCY